MNVLVTGSTGLIGSALVERLAGAGERAVRLVRRAPRPGADELFWDPARAGVAAAALENFDAVVHLAGASLTGRWTSQRKREIYESRVTSTRVLSEALSSLRSPPRALICASAVGYYGDRSDEVLTEESSLGSGFLAEVCRDWESASAAAERKGIRVTRLRTGIVLSARGGALPKMLPPFRMGVGGRFGSGRQYWSWISLEDLVEIFMRVLSDDALSGAINAVSPNPVTNLEFTRELGRALSRPTFLAVPAFAAKLALGEMANEMLLASARVVPARLQAAGFRFQSPALPAALRRILGDTGVRS